MAESFVPRPHTQKNPQERPPDTPTMEEVITQRLLAHFEPFFFSLKDESAKHRHHAPSPQTPQSHFFLTIGAKKLEGLALLRQHQAIYGVLDDLFAKGLHMLRIKVVAQG